MSHETDRRPFALCNAVTLARFNTPMPGIVVVHERSRNNRRQP